MNFSNLWLNWIFRSFDPEQDDEGSRGPSNSSGPSSSNNGGNNIQTFSVTIETTGKPKKFFQQKSASETEIQEPLFNVIHPLSDVKNNDNCLALNRSRRQIKKKKTHYCDHCRMDYDTGWLETVQDFLIKLDIKPLMHLLEISIFSLNNDLLRLTKIMNNLSKISKFWVSKSFFSV